MGKNNRARRAAKQRKRRTQTGPGQRSRPTAADGPGPQFGGIPPAPEELVERTLGSAVYAAAAADGPGAAEWVGQLAELDEHHQELMDQAVRSLAERQIRAAWECGWLPLDLHELARRRLEPAAAPLLLAAIGSEHRRYAPTTLAPRWQDQLDDLPEARPASALRLSHWSRDSGVGRRESLRLAVTVVAFLMALPVLPRLLPLPGESSATRAAPAAGVNEKVLGRIRGLLAKAEASEFPDEAEALSAKAQELMTKFSLDRALVEVTADASAPAAGPTGRRIWVEAPYVLAKTTLVDAVGAANRCRSITYDKLGFITVLGTALDLQLTELLSTSLLVQANRALLVAGRQSGAYGRSRSRAYRQSFLMAYAHRIGQRLRAATETSVTESEDAERLLPVLARREEQVDALFTTLFPDTVMRETRVSDRAGWDAGLTAADLAALDVHQAVGSR